MPVFDPVLLAKTVQSPAVGSKERIDGLGHGIQGTVF